ncbi:hypothetical protein ACQP1K_16065 [Sphaerimonospora sp. CA-214678]|uniref:hypothetical protein n=1 Tax=Sphaerimonospora sp. CA-214678 TaxID=3240029 RepID=UPI003D8ECC89
MTARRGAAIPGLYAVGVTASHGSAPLVESVTSAVLGVSDYEVPPGDRTVSVTEASGSGRTGPTSSSCGRARRAVSRAERFQLN